VFGLIASLATTCRVRVSSPSGPVRGLGLGREHPDPGAGCGEFGAQRMGFAVEPGDKQVNGIQVAAGYDGEGHDRVRFVKKLAGDYQTNGE
jgi:hypothetical protein